MKHTNTKKAVAFILSFVLLFTSSCLILNFKENGTLYKVKRYYNLPKNSLDVLALGTSHTFEGINTSVLWKEFGISCFCLGGAAQRMTNTYYYLEEALKTQQPKVILLDVFGLVYTTDFPTPEFGILNSYGLKQSKTRWDAMPATFDEKLYGKQFYFPILQYHGRYGALSEVDFMPYLANRSKYKNHMGFFCYYVQTPQDIPDFSADTDLKPLTEKNEKYLRKLLDLAASKNIPVIGMTIPWLAEHDQVKMLNTAGNIIKSYPQNVYYDFINTQANLISIDKNTDFSNNMHLNHIGNTKLSRFLGNVLKSSYGIPDRRGDPVYEPWEKDSEIFYGEVENFDLRNTPDAFNYLYALKSDRYVIAISSCGKTVKGLDAVLKHVGLDRPIPSDKPFAAIIKNGKTEQFTVGKSDDYLIERLWVNHSFGMKWETFTKKDKDDNDEQYGLYRIYYSKDPVGYPESDGLTVSVYDTLLHDYVDSAFFRYTDGSLTHIKPGLKPVEKA